MKHGSIWAWGAPLVLLAACNPDVEQTSGTGTQPLNRGDVVNSRELVQPVVIGDSGPRFSACQWTGLVRAVSGNGVLDVRAAPFDEARQVGSLTNGDQIFVCGRSHDQRWFAIVYAASGELSGNCGVSSPISARRRYEGPCESGWVSSAFIQLRATN
ncbi:hypothetical protein [Parasphingopyxis marina]|uniref:Integron n=1 Tax=Parasphingopyxis marina TaxID=2761622 RepID=A0A842HZ77_9SPHN|nr:hypothetical protein [Parasphingopyxis marina]MBC2778486.1 hypothetical protein [Parasphingopyxis marina]